jgi:hypothetical protein
MYGVCSLFPGDVLDHRCDMFDKRKLKRRTWPSIPVKVFLLESSDSQPIADILAILNPCVLVGRILAHSIICGSASRMNACGR